MSDGVVPKSTISLPEGRRLFAHLTIELPGCFPLPTAHRDASQKSPHLFVFAQ